jgi:hypothetical protein
LLPEIAVESADVNWFSIGCEPGFYDWKKVGEKLGFIDENGIGGIQYLFSDIS